MQDVGGLEKSIGVSFNNKDLLMQAMIHRSYLNENQSLGMDHNERLEFLGDAVLELAVTEVLYEKFPEKPEGELTALRAALVNAETLSDIAQKFSFNDYIFLSRGEAKDVGRARRYILANAIEAVIGAIYLDQGYPVAASFIDRAVMPELDMVLHEKRWRDPKSLFQEEAQARVGITPIYQVMKEWGPDHDKHFVVGVYLGNELVSEGEGHSKQEAEVEAARMGLRQKQWL